MSVGKQRRRAAPAALQRGGTTGGGWGGSVRPLHCHTDFPQGRRRTRVRINPGGEWIVTVSQPLPSDAVIFRKRVREKNPANFRRAAGVHRTQRTRDKNKNKQGREQTGDTIRQERWHDLIYPSCDHKRASHRLNYNLFEAATSGQAKRPRSFFSSVSLLSTSSQKGYLPAMARNIVVGKIS